MEDLYTDNYRTLMKEIKEDANKWKDISCSWVGRINIVKISILLKLSIDSVQCLSKFQWHFSKNSKIYERPQIAKTVLRKKNKVELWHRKNSINLAFLSQLSISFRDKFLDQKSKWKFTLQILISSMMANSFKLSKILLTLLDVASESNKSTVGREL